MISARFLEILQGTFGNSWFSRDFWIDFNRISSKLLLRKFFKQYQCKIQEFYKTFLYFNSFLLFYSLFSSFFVYFLFLFSFFFLFPFFFLIFFLAPSFSPFFPFLFSVSAGWGEFPSRPAYVTACNNLTSWLCKPSLPWAVF